MTLVFGKKNHKKIQLLIMLITILTMGGTYADEDTIPYDEALAKLEFPLVKIDLSQLDDPEYEADLIAKTCRMFTIDEAKKLVKLNFLIWKDRVIIPLPHSLSYVRLPPSLSIKALITGATPFRSEAHKAVCLNHLAYAITRNIPYYYFFHVDDFEQTKTTYPHAIKIPAIMASLKSLHTNEWLLWIDDDVVTSDFMSYSYHEQFSLKASMNHRSAPRPMPGRAIKVAKDIRIEEKQKLAEEDAKKEERSPPLPFAEMIVTRDVDRAVMNTGMIWVHNTNAAKELIQFWWHHIKQDQYPIKDKPSFYCFKTDRSYWDIHECLAACNIKHPLQQGFCNSDNAEERAQHEWRMSKERSLFDQDVLKKLYRKDRWSNEEKRNPIMDRLVMIPQRGDFGLKDEEDNIIEESINAFFRTNIHINESVRALDPMLDKWTHMSGIPWGEREKIILIWMANIHNYPLRPEIAPGSLCGRLSAGPMIVYSEVSNQCPDCPEPVNCPPPPQCPEAISQECPACPTCSSDDQVIRSLPDKMAFCEDMGIVQYISVALPSAAVGGLITFLCTRMRRR